MPPFNTKRLSSLPYFILLILLFSYKVTAAQNQKTFPEKDDWKLYPFTLQIASHNGITIPPILMIDTKSNEIHKKTITSFGARLDISLLYANKWIWKNFDCFPKLGLLGKFDSIFLVKPGNMNEKGYIIGGLFYIEPNYLHLKGFEIVPRIGVGVSQIYIPGSFYNGAEPEEERVHSISPIEVEAFSNSIGFNLTTDLFFKYRLTPSLHLIFGMGVDYMPDFGATNSLHTNVTTNITNPNADKSFTLYNANLACSYTFNPSDFNPERDPIRKTRIDLSHVSGFRKLPPPTNNPKNTSLPNPDDNYYIGGIHAQWTLQLAKHHGLVIGTEWVRDLAIKEQQKNTIIKNDIKASFIVGHEFLWGRFILGQYGGFYAMHMGSNPEGSGGSFLNNMFYGQLGALIKITEWLHIGSSIRYIVRIPSTPPKTGQTFILDRECIDFKIGYSF